MISTLCRYRSLPNPFQFIIREPTKNSVAEELYRPSDRHLQEKLVTTLVDKGCHVISVTDSYGRILGFLDLIRYFFLQVAPHLYSRG
jgi:hypothetical protein